MRGQVKNVRGIENYPADFGIYNEKPAYWLDWGE